MIMSHGSNFIRQQLRENDPDLRDLERKLKAAYINKELAAQIEQKEAERLNEKIKAKQTHHILQEAWLEENEKKRLIQQEEINKKAQYKQELQDQMILREQAKRAMYEEFLIHKKVIDDIIQRIHDENEREAIRKICKTKELKVEMEAFKKAQELWKQKKRQELDEENRKIQKFLASKEADVKKGILEKSQREGAKAQLSERIAKELYTQQAKQKERDDIIQELLEEEEKEKIEKRHREDVEKRLRQRIETRDSLEMQIREKEEKQRQENEADAKIRAELLEKLAEDARLDQLSDQKRRMKMLQLRRDTEQMMIERRQKQAEEMQLLMKIEEEAQQELETKRRIVEEERHRMLGEHVKHLIGYLPKGILKVDDLPHLDKEIVEKVSPVYTKN
ncbi:unnamed protein product [Acanthoscelides obtectus]|uniref:Meiosis-specific nuclear structural protein 1 n=1 Tax=Acanthoscelides obtectus TaxID=200917 RepID=A0A9P0P3L2_ACAOB|nr:unnamed protein product [Acanthoscelides obtectus]CAK1662516.1 Meiosis-specific nuclear structural protein 1 [Acanthoscelides obtectus]